jgi:diaminopimelate epimerase
MKLVFYKMTGSGNDFVMLDGRDSDPGEWEPDAIVAICDRRNGIGGDGLVFVAPAGTATVRMTYFNSDGSPAPMCGNAALCATRLAARLELAPPGGMTLVTQAATFDTRCVGPGHLAELHLPDLDLPVDAGATSGLGEQWIELGTVGVPHVVAMVDDIAAVPVADRGRALRFDPAFAPGGANINFVGRVAAADVLAPQWQIRGVEAETLACGTGTVAAAIALAARGMLELPVRMLTASGKVLSVSALVGDGVAQDVWLCGEGRIVARGVWLG